jgi:hypothetical protein
MYNSGVATCRSGGVKTGGFLLVKRTGTMVAERFGEARITTTYTLLTILWARARAVFQLVSHSCVVGIATSTT